MEYKVVCGTAGIAKGAAKELEKEVEKLIKEGYKPFGTLVMNENEAGWFSICQAMVKE